MKTKSFVYSKVFWLAFIQGLVGMVVIFQTTYPEIGGLLIAKTVLDIFLRTIAQMVADAIMLKIGLQDIIGSVLGAIGLGGGGGGGTAKNIVSVAAGALLPKISLGGEGGGVSIGGAGAGAGLFGGNLVDIAYSVADAVSSLGIGAVSDAAYAIADQLAIVEESEKILTFFCFNFLRFPAVRI